jgi:acetyl esterase/lipase
MYKKTEQADLHLYVFLPEAWKEQDARPGIVFFHGGGWQNGAPGQFKTQAQRLSELGMVAVLAEYRLKSLHDTSPLESTEDGMSAMRWVRKHAGDLGIDPSRIAAAGGSAGGHMAACTFFIEDVHAKDDDPAVSPQPNLLVLFNPVMTLAPDRVWKDRFASKDEALRISPNHHLKAGAPPALFMYGSEDFHLAGARAYIEKAEELGSETELFIAEGEEHAFFNRSPWREKTTARAVRFLEKYGYVVTETS